MLLDTDLDEETVRECLRVSAKRASIECIETIRKLHPEIIVDDWLIKFAEQRAFEMDCEKYGVSHG
jgi:hypothetical protein